MAMTSTTDGHPAERDGEGRGPEDLAQNRRVPSEYELGATYFENYENSVVWGIPLRAARKKWEELPGYFRLRQAGELPGDS